MWSKKLKSSFSKKKHRLVIHSLGEVHDPVLYMNPFWQILGLSSIHIQNILTSKTVIVHSIKFRKKYEGKVCNDFVTLRSGYQVLWGSCLSWQLKQHKNWLFNCITTRSNGFIYRQTICHITLDNPVCVRFLWGLANEIFPTNGILTRKKTLYTDLSAQIKCGHSF